MSLTPTVLLDARIYYSSLDVTSYGNKIELAASLESLDRTTFQDAQAGYKTRVGGLADTQASATMFWQAGDLSMPDDVLWAAAGMHRALTVVPASGAVGSLAYLTKTLESDYKQSGEVGKLFMADATWQGTQALARGQILHPQGTARTATGTGTAVQLGPVAANQKVYANLHIFSVAGTTPSLAVKLQSATSSAFTTATDRITFTTATAMTAEPLSLLGPVTDTWWRVSWVITGTTPSFLFAVSAGVASK